MALVKVVRDSDDKVKSEISGGNSAVTLLKSDGSVVTWGSNKHLIIYQLH